MKILISRPDKIGDVVLALHGAKQIKKHLPEAKVYMHISDYTKPLVENIKFIDGIHSFNEKIEANQYDAVVDLMAKPLTAKSYINPKIKIRIGNSARWFRFLYNRTRSIRRSKALMNEAEYNWQLISMLSKDLKYSRLVETLDASDFKEITPYKEFQDFIAILPGATVSATSLSVKQWLELAKQLAAKYPQKQIIYLLGPAESPIEEEIQLEIANHKQICIRKFDSFPEILGFLQAAKYYIGTSTGITHLATSVNCEGIALYPDKKSMHPKRWLPFQSKLKVLSLSKNLTTKHIINTLEGEVPEEFDPLTRRPLSVFIICCNEEKNIRRALESVTWCDEIIIVDSGSTDKTLEIAKEYTNTIFHREWTGHSDQKQFALEKCSNKWVLNIDSDEEVSMELKGQILRILGEVKKPAKGYNICRLIYYLDRWWDKGGWHPEYRLRFFQKEFTKWGGQNPHEKAIVKGKVKKLPGYIYHYTYQDIEHQVVCLQKHATLMAHSLYEDNKKARIYNIFLNPIFRFVKFYFFKFGYREGFPGLIVAVIESYYTYLKYAILWQLQKRKKTA